MKGNRETINRERLNSQSNIVAGMRWVSFDLKPNTHIKSHGHDHVHLCVVQTGGFEELEGLNKKWCSVDIARLSRPCVSHELVTGDSVTTGKMLELLPDWGYFDSRFWQSETRNVFLSGSQLNHRVQNLVSHLETSDYLPLEPFLMIRQLLADIAFPDHNQPAWYPQVKAYLDSHFLLPSLPAILPENVGLHRTHFARQFFRTFGCSVSEYTRIRRLAYAERLLRETDMPLVTVAYETSFSDQSHMTRIFKKCFGVTPTKYRLMRCEEAKNE